MVSDKMAALTEAHFAAAASALTGDSYKIAKQVLHVSEKESAHKQKRLRR